MKISFAFSLLSASLLACLSIACTGPDGSSEGASTDDSASESADSSSAGETTIDGSGSTTEDGSSGTDDGSTDGGDSTLPVDLGASGEFVILAKSGISTVPPSAITGDIGISPAAATFMTGFSLTVDVTNEFATSDQITGKAWASDYMPPTPAKMTAAIGDMELAYTEASGRAADVTELGAGDIGGMTLDPGVYKWGTGVLIPTDITLAGSDTDVWVLQIAGDLTMASGTKVTLTDGALPENVFWQVGGLVDLGTTAHCEGVVLTATSITLRTGASINGRLLAQTAVDLDSSTVVQPAG